MQALTRMSIVLAGGVLLVSSMTAGAQLRRGQGTSKAADRSAAGNAASNGAFRGQRPGGPFGEFIHSLNLTKEQRQKIQPIMKSGHDQAVAVRQDTTLKLPEKREKMRAILQSLVSQIRPILTAEQQSKLDAFVKELKNRRPGAGNGAGPGAGNGAGPGVGAGSRLRGRPGSGVGAGRPGNLRGRPGAGSGVPTAPQVDDLGLDL